MYGCVQYFIIQHRNGGYDIYQSDEQRTMKVYYGFKGNITDFIHEISLFYSKNTDTEGTQKKCVQYFNLPQFLYVNIDDNVLEPFCI
jgi:adenylate cyclase